MLPNLVIIGAAKCGTTSLYRYLDAHPDISMSTQKLDFFVAEPWNDSEPSAASSASSAWSLISPVRSLRGCTTRTRVGEVRNAVGRAVTALAEQLVGGDRVARLRRRAPRLLTALLGRKVPPPTLSGYVRPRLEALFADDAGGLRSHRLRVRDVVRLTPQDAKALRLPPEGLLAARMRAAADTTSASPWPVT